MTLPTSSGPRSSWHALAAGLALIVITLLTVPTTARADAAGLPAEWSGTLDPPAGRAWPVSGGVLRGFEPPAEQWLAGHRGIDLAGQAGEVVVAAAAGTIAWRGSIDGVGMVSVTHPGGLRSTYQPVTAELGAPVVGEQVGAGQPLGRLGPGHCEQACLHLGLKDGQDYLDPLPWLLQSPASIALLPLHSAAPAEPQPGRLVTAVGLRPQGGRPVRGALTSGFGMRLHPVLGSWALHSGIDLAAGCLSPVIATREATVTALGRTPGRGNAVTLTSRLGGSSLVEVFAHLADQGARLVSPGQGVQPGQVIGLVGSTGLSTGCHLHYETRLDGELVDPQLIIAAG